MEREPFSLIRNIESVNHYYSFLSALAIEGENKYPKIRDLFIREPALPTFELANQNKILLNEIPLYYRQMQADEEFRLVVNSVFYPRRIMFQIGRNMVKDFDSDREYVEKLLSGEPVSSRVVEIHATKGTCNYNCIMCLWSDKNNYTYRKQNIESKGLMSLDGWKKTLVGIRDFGARTVVFSGGGEVLLNQNTFQLIELAHSIGLKTQLYTNGFNLRNLNDYEWKQILAMEKIRVSIHAPTEEQYSRIANIPSAIGGLTRVTENLQELLERRRTTNSRTSVGIGFVIQPSNFDQIIDMVNFASQQKVDFLNIRSDEINVTAPLDILQREEARRQLNIVRLGIVSGIYGSLMIDLSDNLTAFANGEDYNIRKVNLCMSKYYRPAINPFGLWMPCDLKAEPMFYDSEYILGDLHNENVEEILRKSQQKQVLSNCKSCMPSGQTGNAVFTKIIGDYQLGIDFRDSPFFI